MKQVHLLLLAMFAINSMPTWIVLKTFLLHKTKHISQFCNKGMSAKELLLSLILRTPV